MKKIRKKLLKKDKGDRSKRNRLEIFLEFFLFGLVMGVAEDLIAVKLSTGESLTWEIIGVVALVALPFAIIGELIVDRIRIIPKNSKKK